MKYDNNVFCKNNRRQIFNGYFSACIIGKAKFSFTGKNL